MAVWRGAERSATEAPRRTTRHSFSFGDHYDPANVGFRSLVAFNDDAVAPGGGYPDHPHRDLEIVTFVVSGALTHRDLHSEGGATTLGPGAVQAITAGTGIVHSEIVDPRAGPTRFLQSWVQPTEPGLVPRHASAASDGGSAWTPLASGEVEALLPIAAAATLWLSAPAGGERVPLPEAAAGHLFVVGRASLRTASGVVELVDGDAVRLSGGGEVSWSSGSRLLWWSFETTG